MRVAPSWDEDALLAFQQNICSDFLESLSAKDLVFSHFSSEPKFLWADNQMVPTKGSIL